MLPNYHFGKRPPKHDHRTFAFAQYRAAASITVPKQFGHYGLVKQWKMLANDRCGNCAWAGAAHETMLWTAQAGKQVLFDDDSVISDYSAVTGYKPSDPSTDYGTFIIDQLNYRRKTGVKDAQGNRHTICAYVQLEPGNYQQLVEAAYLFGAVGVGIELPESAVDQHRRGLAWSFVGRSPIKGGHYVSLVGRDHSCLDIVTWGRIQRMTKQFYERYCDEAYAILSAEMLTDGKSLEGFDLAHLRADLAALRMR